MSESKTLRARIAAGEVLVALRGSLKTTKVNSPIFGPPAATTTSGSTASTGV
ncbi:MAG: hypothetical protein R2867_41335 [Caldilineaceae bacterium]